MPDQSPFNSTTLNRFEITLAAARRARQIANGSESQISKSRSKPTVLALEEITEQMRKAAHRSPIPL